MSFLAFEIKMADFEIKENLKEIRLLFFSLFISIAVLIVDIPILWVNPAKWWISAAIGMMIYNCIWVILHLRCALSDLKIIREKKKAFELIGDGVKSANEVAEHYKN